MTNSTARAIRPACARCGSQLPGTGQACPACGLSPVAGTAVLAPVTHARPARAAGGELTAIAAALAAEYEVLEELGRGGMAIVYRARDRALHRDVALKVLPLTHTVDDEFVERFQQEARTAAQLEHPNIVPIHRVATLGGVSFFTMKLMRGRALSELLHERRILPLPEIRRLLREVGGALAYAAKQGVVHRDIKPDNIMLDADGRFVVTDFGIARSAAAPRLTATGMSVGTPRYMSPEQARAKPLDGRSDIYSLGVVAYQCLAGRVPFEGDEAFAILYSHIHSPVPRPTFTSSEEWELFEIIERMLAKVPDRRVQDGEELVRLVEALEERVRIGTVNGTAPALAVTVASRAIVLRAWPRAGALADRGWSAVRAIGRRLPDASRAILHRAWSVARAGTRRAASTLRVVGGRAHRSGNAVAAGAGSAWSNTRAVSARVVARARSVPGLRWTLASRRRAALSAVAVVAALLGGSRLLHAVVHHSSQCPEPSIEGRLTADGWSVLLDVPSAGKAGDALVVHYDVCGMDRQAQYAVQLTVSRSGGALRRLLGGPAPLVERYDESASGPAVRRHRRIGLDALPAGAYSVEVQVTDAGGRRRRVARELSIEE